MKEIITLSVCHSVGDTDIVVASVLELQKVLFKEIANKIYILITSKAATNRIAEKNLPKNINILNLIDILSGSVFDENGALSAVQLSLVGQFLNSLGKIIGILIGTPSQNNAAAPFQIAQCLSENNQDNQIRLIYNDYLFKEPKHIYWKKLEDKEWPKKFLWLLPVSKAAEAVNKINAELKKEVIGHLALYAAIYQPPEMKGKIIEMRKALMGQDSTHLVFVSGGKSMHEDLELLTSITEVLRKNAQKYNQIDIRIGIHPSLDNLNAYLRTMMTHLLILPVKNSIQFIITKSLLDRIDLNNFTIIDPKDSKQVIAVSDKEAEKFLGKYDCRDSVLAADGVASFSPATLVSQAAARNLPAACCSGDPFVSGIIVGNMAAFFKNVVEFKPADPTACADNREKYSLNPAKIIAEKILSHLTIIPPKLVV